jgi:dual-specificity kinase
VYLGLGWSYPCDAYSLGCILVEFFTGLALYQTHDNLEHLAMMEMVMGRMPDRFAQAGARSKLEFFWEGHKLDWPKAKATWQSKKDVKATWPLQVRHIPSPIYSHSTTSQDVITPTDAINREFLVLVRKLLAFDLATRLTVREALHPYFSISILPEI